MSTHPRYRFKVTPNSNAASCVNGAGSPLPKFLTYFCQVIACNDGDWTIDHRWTYVDTSLFQLVQGLRYMFPRRMATLEPDYPDLVRLHDQVARLPGIKAYLASGRRQPFNQDGIFRHYPELDGD